jgi:hypothetical protein
MIGHHGHGKIFRGHDGRQYHVRPGFFRDDRGHFHRYRRVFYDPVQQRNLYYFEEYYYEDPSQFGNVAAGIAVGLLTGVVLGAALSGASEAEASEVVEEKAY